jgi:hypothetical protein
MKRTWYTFRSMSFALIIIFLLINLAGVVIFITNYYSPLWYHFVGNHFEMEVLLYGIAETLSVLYFLNLLVVSVINFIKNRGKTLSILRTLITFVILIGASIIFTYIEIYGFFTISSGFFAYRYEQSYKEKASRLTFQEFKIENVKFIPTTSLNGMNTYDNLKASFNLYSENPGRYRVIVTIYRPRVTYESLFRDANDRAHEIDLKIGKTSTQITATLIPLDSIRRLSQDGPYFLTIKVFPINPKNSKFEGFSFTGDSQKICLHHKITEKPCLYEDVWTIYDKNLVTPAYLFTDWRIPKETYYDDATHYEY